MAHVRDSDTSLWLHNKLGSSNDLWLGGSICSQLNQDVLRNIRECFIELQPQVKLKLLLSFLHIPRRNVQEWRVELEEILEVALVDSDQWVSMLAELLKSYPSSGLLNFMIEENASVFTDVVNELKKLVRKHSDQGLLPLECLYLNRSALAAVVGQVPQPTKHFTLKQKPKSATLRAELLQKSNDMTSMRKSTTTSSVPIRCRGLIKPLGDATPLKGIPTRPAALGFKARSTPLGRINTSPSNRTLTRPPSGRKDGGIKLLEIDEQPMGYGRDAKRRKRITDDVSESKKEKEGAPAVSTQAPTTPDYAVGLLSSTSQLPATAMSVIASAGTPSYGPPSANLVISNVHSIPAGTPASNITTAAAVVPAKDQQFIQQEAHTTTEHAIAPKNPEQTSTVIHTTTISSLASLGGSVQIQPQSIVTNFSQTQAPVQTQTMQQPAQPHIYTPAPVQPQTMPIQKKLSLTKEQMQEAQDMFNKSNKVTRPEKALILGFIAGSRDNPCPHLGQIVTIMLSENEEKVQQSNGTSQTMMVETHFQMNYSTGEWKRVKKFKRVESS